MRIARVVGNLVSTHKLPAYEARKLMIIEELGLDREPLGKTTMAIDYVGAGPGDTVLVGAAPGLASLVFKIERAPINDLIMGIIDRVDSGGVHEAFGNSVR